MPKQIRITQDEITVRDMLSLQTNLSGGLSKSEARSQSCTFSGWWGGSYCTEYGSNNKEACADKELGFCIYWDKKTSDWD